jgi:hypothetical protein
MKKLRFIYNNQINNEQICLDIIFIDLFSQEKVGFIKTGKFENKTLLKVYLLEFLQKDFSNLNSNSINLDRIQNL